MISLLRSEAFDSWLASLADERGKARIVARLISAEFGNFGDCKPVGGGVSEMRIDHGPGYRVYFTRRGKTVYLILAGGEKASQKRDIVKARNLALKIGRVGT